MELILDAKTLWRLVKGKESSTEDMGVENQAEGTNGEKETGAEGGNDEGEIRAERGNGEGETGAYGGNGEGGSKVSETNGKSRERYLTRALTKRGEMSISFSFS